MAIDGKIVDKKNAIGALSSGKIDRYEYLTGESRILPTDQSRIIEVVQFIYSPLAKTFEKHIKIIEDEGIKQVEALKALKPEKKDIKPIE